MDKDERVFDLKTQKIFRPLRDYFIWAIEWQRATGTILASETRTREAGLAKLADADRREAKFKNWTGEDRQ